MFQRASKVKLNTGAKAARQQSVYNIKMYKSDNETAHIRRHHKPIRRIVQC